LVLSENIGLRRICWNYWWKS